MCLSMLKKSSFIYICLLLAGCSAYKGSIDIPEEWHTPLLPEMKAEETSCFPWWESLNDPILNELVRDACKSPDVQLALCQGSALEAVNKVSADIARTYIQIRGLQARLELIEEHVTAQATASGLSAGLSQVGFISTANQNENTGQLFVLLAQKTEIKVALDRAVIHLATLLAEPLDCLEERLSCGRLFDLPCYLPVATPCAIVHNHPAIGPARAAYSKSPSRLAFYHYQKQVGTVFEEVEGAIAGLKGEKEALKFFEGVKDLKAENYQLVKDLNQQGLKSDAELQAAYQEQLSAEDAYIQSKVKLLIEYVNLYEAQGGGWE